MPDTSKLSDQVTEDIVRQIQSEAAEELTDQLNQLLNNRLGAFQKEMQSLVRQMIAQLVREALASNFPNVSGNHKDGLGSSLFNAIADGSQSLLNRSDKQQAVLQNAALSKASRLL